MSSTVERYFGIEFDLMRNDNAPQVLRLAADKIEKRINALKSVGSMENFWSTDITWIKNGKPTTEPFDPTEGIEYVSVKPIRLVIDPGYAGKDVLDEVLMKKAFIKYCDLAKQRGYELPKFNSKLDKLRFHVRHLLVRLRVI